MHWKETFILNGSLIYYNRINYNNAAERSIEVPIAFNFLAHSLADIRGKAKILEIGNVLSNYENSLSDYLGIRPRRVVDKYEVGLGVENTDMMDILDTDKYDIIIAISTVEHVGQEGYRGKTKADDNEAPLKAIAKIYHLLKLGGKALVTVPFGKLIKGRDFIQFNQDYLALLSSKYQIPLSALSVSWLKRIATEIGRENPRQLWVQVEGTELSHAEYNWPWPYSNGIAVIELEKISECFSLNLTISPENWIYYPGIAEDFHSELFRETYVILDRLRDINLVIFPNWSVSSNSLYLDLNPIIKLLLSHPDRFYLSLLIDTSNIAAEEADLILSNILMNIFSVESLDINDEPEIILLENLSQLQWQALLPRIHWHVVLDTENESAVTAAGAQNLPACTIDHLSRKRANQLETGPWEFK
ncbi:MAG TPA: hypothetical protein V6D11_25465 [Waterburya sp.]|jgi:hypothetical protein